jgi:hypothetical protein
MFYTRDSITRSLLAKNFDNFNSYSKDGRYAGLNWTTKIDYRHEEILASTTNYCQYYKVDYLYNYSDNMLIVDKQLLLYSYKLGETINIFPEFSLLHNTNSKIDTNLSIYNSWNKNADDVDILPILNPLQIEAYKIWTSNKHKIIQKKLSQTVTPKKIIFPCDSSYDFRTRLNRKILKKGNSYQVHLFDNNKNVRLTGHYKSIYPDIKNGQFTFFEEGKPFAIGYYQNNYPVGEWVFYDSNGVKDNVINYSEVYEFLKTELVQNQLLKVEQVDASPEFISEEYESFLGYIAQNFNLPPYLKLDNSTMKNKVYFVINQLGGIENIEIVEGDIIEFNIEIIRLLSNCPNWIPAKKDGKPVSVEIVMPFEY